MVHISLRTTQNLTCRNGTVYSAGLQAVSSDSLRGGHIPLKVTEIGPARLGPCPNIAPFKLCDIQPQSVGHTYNELLNR